MAAYSNYKSAVDQGSGRMRWTALHASNCGSMVRGDEVEGITYVRFSYVSVPKPGRNGKSFEVLFVRREYRQAAKLNSTSSLILHLNIAIVEHIVAISLLAVTVHELFELFLGNFALTKLLVKSLLLG